MYSDLLNYYLFEMTIFYKFDAISISVKLVI